MFTTNQPEPMQMLHMSERLSCCVCGTETKAFAKTSWPCPECKADTTLAIEKLCQTITSLQQTVSELATKQDKLDYNQKVLGKENTEL